MPPITPTARGSDTSVRPSPMQPTARKSAARTEVLQSLLMAPNGLPPESESDYSDPEEDVSDFVCSLLEEGGLYTVQRNIFRHKTDFSSYAYLDTDTQPLFLQNTRSRNP